MEKEASKFEVIVLGLIFNPSKKKILIAKKVSHSNSEEFAWYFPGGRLREGEGIDHALKRIMKLKTGYIIKNIGTFFSRTYKENPNIVSISFLTRVFEGEETPGDDILELKWISPTEIEEHFKVPIHKKLKEFLLELI
jgi:ADP-ribose pyrophosphatase YjhB (NUDIX family)